MLATLIRKKLLANLLTMRLAVARNTRFSCTGCR
jgi:hypothetical protein